MEGDIFISTSRDSSVKEQSDTDNFFVNQTTDLKKTNSVYEPLRHLNDYDSNILGDGAYQDISDEVLKLEYKISHTEDDIKNIDSQIQAAQSIGDISLTGNLYTMKMQREVELKNLMDLYRDASLSARISGGIISKLKTKILSVKNKIFTGAINLVSKYSDRFSLFLRIKSSLSNLSDINKSVDELMANQYPAWESNERYERLSKYISKANSIQADISRSIK